MSYLFDACALLNLSNGGVLAPAFALPASNFVICHAVHKETPTIRRDLEVLAQAGVLQHIDDNAISASKFLEIKEKYNLGDGETECIVFAMDNNCKLVFDDRAARKIATILIGAERVTGSIGLLRECVVHTLLTREAAYEAYRTMKAMGGYLPEMTITEMFK